MEEKKYAFKGKIVFEPQKVNEYNGKRNIGFKIEENNEFFNYYQPAEKNNEEFDKLMKEDFKKGYVIQFNEIQNIVTDYEIVERKESKSSFFAKKQDPTTMYVSYAKDIFIALKQDDKNKDRDSESLMSESIHIIRQAKTAFE